MDASLVHSRVAPATIGGNELCQDGTLGHIQPSFSDHQYSCNKNNKWRTEGHTNSIYTQQGAICMH